MQIERIIAAVDLSEIPAGDIFSIGIAVIGLLFLCNWYVRLNGINSLSSAPTRRNNMPFFLPFALMMVWMMLTVAVGSTAGFFGHVKDKWIAEFAVYIFSGILSITMVVCFLIIGHQFFERGLKGFGLDRRTIGRDIGAAFINYITVMPLVLAGLWAVMIVGTLIYDGDFQMTQHDSLALMASDSPLMLKTLAVLLAVIITPVFEEVLFRGLFQSSIVSITSRPWFSIAVTSLFFVMLHTPKHWPALFALSMCMGYTYERSGSLYRAIFVHMIFNGISTAATLLAV